MKPHGKQYSEKRSKVARKHRQARVGPEREDTMTDKATHALEPWTAQQDCRHSQNTGIITDGPMNWAVYGSSRICVLSERTSFRSESEVKANAERIAACVNACEGINPEAVPELLEACNMAVEALKDHPQYDNPDDEPSLEALALNAAKAALVKAEGKAVPA